MIALQCTVIAKLAYSMQQTTFSWFIAVKIKSMQTMWNSYKTPETTSHKMEVT